MAVTGRALALTLAGIVPVVIWPGCLAFLGVLLVVAAIIAIDIRWALPVDAIEVTRQPLSPVRLGASTTSVVNLRNPTTQVMRARVRDAWPPSAHADPLSQRVVLTGGQSVAVETRVEPTTRGDAVSAFVAIRSTGPMGIGARQKSVEVPATLRVLPPFRSHRVLPSRLAKLRELDGATRVQIRGQGTEFDSLRDYVIGDDVRTIDWRATARRQQVVVRTWRPERDRQVLVVLDTSRTSASRVGDESRLEAGMEAGVLLSALASHAGDRVQLLAMDRKVQAHVKGLSGTEVLPAMMDALAGVEASLLEADWTAVVSMVRRLMTQRALVVLVTSLDSPAAVEEGLLPVIQLLREHQVVVASVSDPRLAQMGHDDIHTVSQVYEAASASRAHASTAAVAAELRRSGVNVVEGTPETLPARLADRYLFLKAAGKL